MFARLVTDMVTAFQGYLNVPIFSKKHQLWRGFSRHRVVLIAMVVIAVLFGLVMWKTIYSWWSNFESNSVIDASLQTAGLLGDLATTGYEFAFAGAYKYLVLIVMELLIFHISLRTNEILTGERSTLTAGIFIQAQIRMIKVSVYVFFLEIVASIGISIGIAIIGFEFIKPILLFVVQCFFLGFALIDNYHEINGLTIRASFKKTKSYPGAAFGIGLVLYLLILLPLVGPIIGPMVGAVAATLTMHAISSGLTVRELVAIN